MNTALSLLYNVAADLYKVNLKPLPNPTANAGYIQIILTIIFSLVGALALLFVTIGGFRYIASQGDPQATARAKNTIAYALVGLVVSISAVAIVTFVTGRL